MSLFASEERRLATAARVLAVAMLLCLAFSWRLWTSTRLYPLVPMLGLVPAFPRPLDAAALALLVAMLMALAIRPLARPLAGGIVVLVAVLFAQDQSRLWPSFYLFFFLFLLLLGHRRGGGEADAGRTLAGMRFAVASVYFWGGIQKLTPAFFHEEFPWFVKPMTDLLPGPLPGLPAIAAIAAVAEATVGLGLVTTRFRTMALWEGLAMHSLILVFIGPLRGDWNDSAWIWSQTMAALLVTLFHAAPPFRFAAMFAGPPARNLPAALAAVFLGILPVLNNVNLWDSALSFNIYSGNVSRGLVLFHADAAASLPPEMAAHVAVRDEWAVLDPNAWSMRQFNAGIYPEERIFRAILATVCERLPQPSARLVFEEKSSWLQPRKNRELACENR